MVSSNSFRKEKVVPVHRVSFWRGVLGDYLLRMRWVLKVLGKKRKRQLLRSLFPDPLPEGHPVDRDNFFCLIFHVCFYSQSPDLPLPHGLAPPETMV